MGATLGGESEIGDIDSVDELIRRLRHYRDEAAFREIYLSHTPRLARFVHRLLGSVDRPDVEDVVQETWLRAVEGLADFDGRSTLMTWLHGIALNVTREFLRGRKREREREGGVEGTRTVTRPVDVEQGIDLERALAQLSDKRRLVLVLHDLEGYRHRDIAAQLGISEGTSKSQLHDARRRVTELLKGRTHDR